MYCDYNLLMQRLNDIVIQNEQSQNNSDKRIIDTLRKTIDALKSTSELTPNERQMFLNLLYQSMVSSVVLAENLR